MAELLLVGATHWGAGFGTLRLVCVQARVVANTGGVFPVHTGTWCSGITSALHAEGPGFNPQCVHFAARARGGQPKNIRTPTVGPEPTSARLKALRFAG